MCVCVCVCVCVYRASRLHVKGCDDVINSYKRLDKCGDCGGDGSRCTGIFIQFLTVILSKPL